ncbi:polymorphic toxin-type HINT domain-containing protein [Pseudoalteromonas sp. Ld20]|uniref:polymorphic toxin-type HINT domain-containing protein n=1 Tax=Pseudoalteromonas sp. Ld20 TaxID=649165 RepID=UPI003869487B
MNSRRDKFLAQKSKLSSAVLFAQLKWLSSLFFPKESKVTTSEDSPGYTGHLEDDDLQLTYMQARYYDPVIGRFYSNDPVGYTASNPVMSFNRYLYVNNNPYKYTDPNGEFLNFAVKFVADVALGAALNYAETGSVNLGGAVADAAAGALNPAKTVQKAKRLAKVIKGGCSFTPETMILTKDGYKSIIEVNVGDIVLSKNDETGQVSWREVTDTFKDWHTETITFTVVDENGVEESITTTAEHPFYVDNQGWLPAGDVSEGTVISGPKVDNNISIVNIQVNQEPQYAYNFTVNTDHTYFVGKTNMWVHNACDFSKVPKSPTGRGSAAPGDRDPKRTYSRGEINEMLQDQGGKCAGCGETKSLSEVDGHHVQRHADGGPTTKENGAALCKDCHKEVHAKEK